MDSFKGKHAVRDETQDRQAIGAFSHEAARDVTNQQFTSLRAVAVVGWGFVDHGYGRNVNK